ncbi:hypothetical protein FH972_024034 [Carpinus fangiana]|uniref:Uncharacterized protein n=1 Tax=Carpinus fangiana TaxID=176857 RepID=A0A5N6KXA0_9ROSI|nr:hypothetical protein FH972_024034 [Carpinus fangiana]
MGKKQWKILVKAVCSGDGWKKLIRPTVPVHGTAWPKTQPELQKYGIRFDYAGKFEKLNKTYHRFQAQVNAGKIPASWEDWRKRNGGTHAIVATIEVPEDGTADDVQEALEAVEDDLSA